MIEPKDLDLKNLKGMHKRVREEYNCAVDFTVMAEASIVLGMIDDELVSRGYDPSKLFKGYDPSARYQLKS